MFSPDKYLVCLHGSSEGVERIPILHGMSDLTGKRTIKVQVTGDGYDQTKTIDGEFVKDAGRTLKITFGPRTKDLNLAWQDELAAPTGNLR